MGAGSGQCRAFSGLGDGVPPAIVFWVLEGEHFEGASPLAGLPKEISISMFSRVVNGNKSCTMS